MTTWERSQLEKAARKRSEYEAKGLPLPRELTTEYLAEHYQKSTTDIEELLKPRNEQRHVN